MRIFSWLLGFFAYALIKLGGETGSITITEAFQRQWHDTIKLSYQQLQSFVATVLTWVNRGVVGELDSFDRIGAVIANDIVDRHGDTTYLNPPHSRRWARLIPSDGAALIDREDKVRTLIDPQSAYNRLITAALRRREDKHVINAATGSALEGQLDQGGNATSVVLPAGQKIAIGASPNDVLTLDKIKDTAALLDKAGVPTGAENRCFFYAPGQTKAILNITQAASSDFTAMRIYDKGTIDGEKWMGFTWKLIPDVLDPGGTVLQRMLALTGTERFCIAMSRDAVGLSIGMELTPFMDVLPQKRHALQVRAEIMMGSVRTWDTGVVQVSAKEE